jgi:hypothetical protein
MRKCSPHGCSLRTHIRINIRPYMQVPCLSRKIFDVSASETLWRKTWSRTSVDSALVLIFSSSSSSIQMANCAHLSSSILLLWRRVITFCLPMLLTMVSAAQEMYLWEKWGTGGDMRARKQSMEAAQFSSSPSRYGRDMDR